MQLHAISHPSSGLTLRDRRAYLIETAVFVLVLLPMMGFAVLGGRPEELTFPLVAAVIIFHNVALVALVLYFVWRNGEGVAAIGWVNRGAGREVLVGIGLFVPLLIGIGVLEASLRAAGFDAPARPPPYLLPRGGADYLIALLLLFVVAVSEETVFRGYLLRRFTQVSGSRVFAVTVSSLVFALGHGYQGSLGIVAVGFIGAAFAIVYLRRGSLVAPMTMHYIQNFIGLVIAPQFLGR